MHIFLLASSALFLLFFPLPDTSASLILLCCCLLLIVILIWCCGLFHFLHAVVKNFSFNCQLSNPEFLFLFICFLFLFYSAHSCNLFYIPNVAFLLGCFGIELCGTPGYISPEMLNIAMYEDQDEAEGYDLAIDL